MRRDNKKVDQALMSSVEHSIEEGRAQRNIHRIFSTVTKIDLRHTIPGYGTYPEK